MAKKVSVIIPCYNQAEFVKEAIASALAQTYKNIEMVIINDGSSDNSSEVINSAIKGLDNVIFIDNKDNQGVVRSRNMAISASGGEYILPLDADDTIEPTYVEKAVNVLENSPQIGIVYSKARFFGAVNGAWKLPEFNKENILFQNCIFCSALYRKVDFYKAGGYKEYMKNGFEDWDLWLSFLELGVEVHRIDEVLFNYRQHLGGNRSDYCNGHGKSVLPPLVKNHMKLYLSSDKCLNSLVELLEGDCVNAKDYYKKLLSYKRLCNRVLYPLLFLETVIILFLILLE